MQIRTVLIRLRSGRGVSNAIYRGDLIFSNGNPELVKGWSGRRGSSDPETRIALDEVKLTQAPPGRGYDFLYLGWPDGLVLPEDDDPSGGSAKADGTGGAVPFPNSARPDVLPALAVRSGFAPMRNTTSPSAIEATEAAIAKEVMASAIERRRRQPNESPADARS